MGDLEPLSKILKESNEPNSSRQLTEAARWVLKQGEYMNYDSALASIYIT